MRSQPARLVRALLLHYKVVVAAARHYDDSRMRAGSACGIGEELGYIALSSTECAGSAVRPKDDGLRKARWWRCLSRRRMRRSGGCGCRSAGRRRLRGERSSEKKWKGGENRSAHSSQGYRTDATPGKQRVAYPFRMKPVNITDPE
jgi:hypothetical protein